MSAFYQAEPRESTQGAQPLVQRPTRLSDVLYKIIALEFVAIFLAASIAMGLYYWSVLGAQVSVSFCVGGALAIATLIVLVSIAFHHYAKIQSHRKRWYVRAGIGAVSVAFTLFLSLLFLSKIADQYSRGAFLFQFVVVSMVIVAVRAITSNELHAAIAKNKIEARRLILIGRNDHCGHVMEKLIKSGLRIQATIPFPPTDAIDDNKTSPNDDDVFRQIARQCRPLSPDDILILATEKDLANVQLLAGALSELPASLHMMPFGLEGILATAKFAELGLVPTIQLLEQPLSQFDRFVKRAFDLIISTMGLVLFCPLFILVAVAIKLESRGPAIFRQHRHGFNNEIIRVFKFRTMRTIEDGANFTQAVKNDPRVTKFGSILRKTNIDELPQLVNVLLGEMSLVGPRPHPLALNFKFEDKLIPLFRRHNVKPGITGWAQVNGCRGETDTLEKMQKRLQYDLYYIDHWSFLLDMQIIMMTLVSKKAYSNAC